VRNGPDGTRCAAAPIEPALEIVGSCVSGFRFKLHSVIDESGSPAVRGHPAGVQARFDHFDSVGARFG
jgi:hypothetical protein